MKEKEKSPAAIALGRRFKECRLAAGLSQKPLAVAAGMKSQQSIQKIEAGEVERPKRLRELAREMRTNEDYLLTGKGPKGILENSQSTKKPPRELTLGKQPLVETFDPDEPTEGGDDEPLLAVHEGGGRHNIPEGEIPQVSALLGLGHAAAAQLIEVPAGRGSIAAVEVVATWKVPDHVLRRRLAGASIASVHIVECEGDSMEPRIRDGDFVFIDTSRRIPAPPGIFAISEGYSQTLKRIEIIPNSDPTKVLLIPENPRHKSYERLLEEVTIIGRYMCRLTMD